MKPLSSDFYPLGDSAITIRLAENSDDESVARARAIAQRIRAARLLHVEETISAYTAVTVFYDALHKSYDQLRDELARLLEGAHETSAPAFIPRAHVIPVRYDGPDLDSVAQTTGLSRDEVIAIHSGRTYSVDLLGFVPGFAYLSETDKRLQLPRRSQPRPRVPAGSVAIAARLTGVYPFETPGGWHILGRTSELMFDPRRADPSLLRAGDTVKFEPVA